MENENLEKKKRLEAKAGSYLTVASITLGLVLAMITTDKVKITRGFFVSCLAVFAQGLALIFFYALVLFPQDINKSSMSSNFYNKIASLLMMVMVATFAITCIIFLTLRWRTL